MVKTRFIVLAVGALFLSIHSQAESYAGSTGSYPPSYYNSGATAGPTGVAPVDNDLFTRLWQMYDKAGMPITADLHAPAVWIGKCVDDDEGMVRRDAALVFSVENDPVLKSIFYIVPLLDVKETQLDYERLATCGTDKIRSGDMISTVGTIREWGAYITKFRRDGRERSMLVRQMLAPNKKVMLVTKLLRYAPPISSNYYGSTIISSSTWRSDASKFCYFYDERTPGSANPVNPPGEPVIAPQPPPK